MIELFVCKPLKTKLTRKACAERHCKAKRDANRTREDRGQKMIGYQCCAPCELGAAHDRGEERFTWPDGTIVEIVDVEPGRSRWLGEDSPRSEERPEPAVAPPHDTVAARSAPRDAEHQDTVSQFYAESSTPTLQNERTTMEAATNGSGKTYTYNGKTLSLHAWAREPEVKALGLTQTALYYRIKKGWSLKETLTTPNQTYGAAAPPKAARPPKSDNGATKHTRSKPPATPTGPVRTVANVGRSPAAELLAAAGYSVTETRCPRGVVLIVEGPGL